MLSHLTGFHGWFLSGPRWLYLDPGPAPCWHLLLLSLLFLTSPSSLTHVYRLCFVSGVSVLSLLTVWLHLIGVVVWHLVTNLNIWFISVHWTYCTSLALYILGTWHLLHSDHPGRGILPLLPKVSYFFLPVKGFFLFRGVFFSADCEGLVERMCFWAIQLLFF